MLRSIKPVPLITGIQPHEQIVGAIRLLRTNINLSAAGAATQVILVTSAREGEGRSTVAANLAIAYALEHKRVLMIDTDLRKPSVHHIFGKSNRMGLANVLEQQCTVNEAIRETHVEGLSILSGGLLSKDPTELLSSVQMKEMIEQLRDRYDMIILDSPPALKFADAQLLSVQSDGVLLVIQCGQTKSKMVKRVKAVLDMVNAPLLAAVLNQISSSDQQYALYYG